MIEMTMNEFIHYVANDLQQKQKRANIERRKRRSHVTQRRVTRSNATNARNIRNAKRTRYFNAY